MVKLDSIFIKKKVIVHLTIFYSIDKSFKLTNLFTFNLNWSILIFFFFLEYIYILFNIFFWYEKHHLCAKSVIFIYDTKLISKWNVKS